MFVLSISKLSTIFQDEFVCKFVCSVICSYVYDQVIWFVFDECHNVMIKIFNSCTRAIKTLTLPNFCDSRFSIPLTIESPTIAHVPDGQQDWLSLSLIFCYVHYGCSLVLSLSFFSFVSKTIFSCDEDLREVFWIYSVFLFRDSFQLLVHVSIHSVYFIVIWVTWYAYKHLNLPIMRYIVILISWESFLMKLFIVSFFISILVFRKWIFFSRFAIILFFYLRVFGVHLDCIDLLFGRPRHDVFDFLVFNIFVHCQNLSENSVASGSVSLDMKKSIWYGTLFKGLSRFTIFSAIGVFVIVRIGG